MSEAPRDTNYFFSSDLPTRPRPEDGVVLVTGASGYIGGRLVPELIERGYRVRVLVRGGAEDYSRRWPGAEIVEGDALDRESLSRALAGVHAAYFLIHSLLLGPDGFFEADMEAAANFCEAAAEQRVGRIIYLGGLADRQASKSRHLRARMEVGAQLAHGPVPVTTLRAAIIIGSGSASYEIIRSLVSRAPVILMPPWARNLCQPIGIRDVIKYLVGALETPATQNRSFDIGGADRLTYEQMLRTFAEIIGKRILFIPIPVRILPIRFYGYIAGLITTVPAPITASLMEGLQDESVVQGDDLRELIPFEQLSYREAVARALTREEQDQVHTRWSDSYPPAHELAMKLAELEGGPTYTASFFILTDQPADALFRSACAVGGQTGWFDSNWMWWMRGVIDRVLFGVGTGRGRKSQTKLEVHDVIDFFRVEDLQPDRRLLLRAEMKLPGKAWLEFRVDPDPDGEPQKRQRLSITASFQTTSLFGKVYWYFFLPFHHFIFADLLEHINRRSPMYQSPQP